MVTNVYATGGGLRKASIKTCPDGVTYGMHSDGNGGTHWHRAATNGNNYYAVGDAIYNDPCPGSSGNQGTAESTQGGGSNNSSYSNNNSGYSNSNSNSYSQPATPVAPQVVQKSGDASLKSLTADGKNVEISDTMVFETDKDSIEIIATANHSKASVKVNGETKKLKLDNKFEIVITAEAGNTKTYILNVTRKPKTSNTKLSLKINGTSISFDQENHYETSEFYSTKTVKFTYELSNEKSSLKIYKDNKEINDEDEIVLGKNNYKFVVTDENGDFVEYSLTIDKMGKTESSIIEIVSIIIAILFLNGLLIGGGFFIYWLIKKSNKKR